MVYQPWTLIIEAMSTRLDKEVKLFQFLTNKAFIRCEKRGEFLKLTRIGRLLIQDFLEVVLSKWEQRPVM